MASESVVVGQGNGILNRYINNRLLIKTVGIWLLLLYACNVQGALVHLYDSASIDFEPDCSALGRHNCSMLLVSSDFKYSSTYMLLVAVKSENFHANSTARHTWIDVDFPS